jgi:hypothetical protein
MKEASTLLGFPGTFRLNTTVPAAVPLVRHGVHGEWNYTIQPAQPAVAKPPLPAR